MNGNELDEFIGRRKIGELVWKDDPAVANKIYSLRNSLIWKVRKGLISQEDLEAYISWNSGTPEAGLVSTVGYMNPKNYRGLKRMAEFGLAESFGFMACTKSINYKLSENQGMFVEGIPSAKKWHGNAGKFAKKIKLVKGCYGFALERAEDISHACKNYGESLKFAKRIKYADRNFEDSLRGNEKLKSLRGGRISLWIPNFMTKIIS